MTKLGSRSGYGSLLVAAASISVACDGAPSRAGAAIDGGAPNPDAPVSIGSDVHADDGDKPLSALTRTESVALCFDELERTDPCLAAGAARESREACEETTRICRDGFARDAEESCASADYAIAGCDATRATYLSCIQAWTDELSCERAGLPVLAPTACRELAERCPVHALFQMLGMRFPLDELPWSPDPSIPVDLVVGNDLTLEEPKQGFQLRTRGMWIEPGYDVEYFEILEVPGAATETHYVTRIEIEMTGFTHHAIVASIRAGSELESELVVGARGSGSAGSLLLGGGDLLERVTASQQPYSDDQYPPGVGRIFHGGQKILVDYHYLNTSAGPVPAGHRINFHTSPSVEAVAGQFLWLNTDISIPPRSSASTTGTGAFERDTIVFKLTRHTHRLGTDFEVFFQGGERDGEHVFTSTDWEHDADHVFPAEGILLQRGEGFRYVCHYESTVDVPVGWGERATDEMCILFGLAYNPGGGAIEF